MIAKDPGKMHYYISLVKSGIRIAGCIVAVLFQSITIKEKKNVDDNAPKTAS